MPDVGALDGSLRGWAAFVTDFEGGLTKKRHNG